MINTSEKHVGSSIVCDKIRVKHYSTYTEQAYVDWTRRYILLHDKRHPCQIGALGVEAFLIHLAVDRKVLVSTQIQARSALLFMYKEVLLLELPYLEKVERPKLQNS